MIQKILYILSNELYNPSNLEFENEKVDFYEIIRKLQQKFSKKISLF